MLQLTLVLCKWISKYDNKINLQFSYIIRCFTINNVGDMALDKFRS